MKFTTLLFSSFLLTLSCFSQNFSPIGGGGTNIIYTTNIFPASATATISTLSAGSSATVSVVGSSNLTFAFAIPRGADGTNGINGTNGVNGTKGDTGNTGNTGATGPAGSNGTNGTNGINAVILTHTFNTLTGGTTSWTHGYGSKPTYIAGVLNCVSNDGGMVTGESVPLLNVQDASYSQPYFDTVFSGTTITLDSVNTSVSAARVTAHGTRNTVSSWSNFTITIVYQ